MLKIHFNVSIVHKTPDGIICTHIPNVMATSTVLRYSGNIVEIQNK